MIKIENASDWECEFEIVKSGKKGIYAVVRTQDNVDVLYITERLAHSNESILRLLGGGVNTSGSKLTLDLPLDKEKGTYTYDLDMQLFVNNELGGYVKIVSEELRFISKNASSLHLNFYKDLDKVLQVDRFDVAVSEQLEIIFDDEKISRLSNLAVKYVNNTAIRLTTNENASFYVSNVDSPDVKTTLYLGDSNKKEGSPFKVEVCEMRISARTPDAYLKLASPNVLISMALKDGVKTGALTLIAEPIKERSCEIIADKIEIWHTKQRDDELTIKIEQENRFKGLDIRDLKGHTEIIFNGVDFTDTDFKFLGTAKTDANPIKSDEAGKPLSMKKSYLIINETKSYVPKLQITGDANLLNSTIFKNKDFDTLSFEGFIGLNSCEFTQGQEYICGNNSFNQVELINYRDSSEGTKDVTTYRRITTLGDAKSFITMIDPDLTDCNRLTVFFSGEGHTEFRNDKFNGDIKLQIRTTKGRHLVSEDNFFRDTDIYFNTEQVDCKQYRNVFEGINTFTDSNAIDSTFRNCNLTNVRDVQVSNLHDAVISNVEETVCEYGDYRVKIDKKSKPAIDRELEL